MTISKGQDITGRPAGRFADLVRPDEGLVDRSIFTDEDIYQLELERILRTMLVVSGARVTDPQGR